jgi:alanine-glyoxylate transaminase/serine-glyoxylate transaminase/serine-pyruvate transaminase
LRTWAKVPGRHFLQIPGPTNVPDRILHAISNPTIDHRSADFAALTSSLHRRHEGRVQDNRPAMSSFSPAPGTGAWEAALVNTLSAGDSGSGFR